jgi:L-asparaginase/Glu-tRNA(Gln) amidotransferase subunit D
VQLENLDRMVVVTGSMLPLSDLFNDAHRNLIVSVVMAATLNIPEVTIFMDDQLLRGNRTVKSNSSGLDAFESPNYPALARLETGLRIRYTGVLASPKGRFRVHATLDPNVAVWRMIPGFDDEYIANSITHSKKLKVSDEWGDDES